ncbi:hypothetical protein OG21DRAFT_1490526 [Imleria badia]|nr:hypothetical protein OG21DRAFT_1490526 [Imleria badia]
MPHVSARQELLNELHYVALHVLEAREQVIHAAPLHDDDNFDFFEDIDDDNNLAPIIITPPSPILPIIFLDILDSDSESDGGMQDQDRPYRQLLGEITALIDEVERMWFLNNLEVPLLHAPQIHLLEHFAVFRPHLFRKKICVDPAVFDCIVDKIREHPIFHLQGPNVQLPVSIQLAVETTSTHCKYELFARGK